MTERKPPGTSFTSWIDKQIAEAAERGAFDNLPGAGKPIPHHGDEDAGQAWMREYLRREGVSADLLLPTPLRLRKQAAQLAQAAPAMACEQEVADAVGELNAEIMAWRKLPLGPPVFVPLVDAGPLLRAWRDAHPGPGSEAHASGSETPAGQTPETGEHRRSGRSRWGRRRRR